METMKIIVAGGRNFDDYELLRQRLDYYFMHITPIIVCGEAKGADSLGRKYAEEHGLEIMSFPAKWEKEGRSAGYNRNIEMSKVADGLVAFWDGKSSGTGHMIKTMRKLGKSIRIVRYE